MTIKEIRMLIDEYHKLQKSDPENSNFFSNAQKQVIVEKLNSEIELFSTTAKDFEYAIKEIFVQNKVAPFSSINLRAQVKNIKIENSSFCYYLKLLISIDYKTSHLNQSLANLAIISKNEIEDAEFTRNLYTINLLPILLETNIKNSDLIHRACWNIIANNLTPTFEQKYTF